MPAITELLWAFVGLLLTISGTLVEASVSSPPWMWFDGSIETYSLGVSYQVGAVLFVACVGGKNAAALSQIAYITLGLTPWFPVFSQGGGLEYLSYPGFGYILGFLPGGWLCGWLAFRQRPRVEALALSSLAGLAAIHATGIAYALIVTANTEGWWAAISMYSGYFLPGQLALACVASSLAFVLRQLLFLE